MIAETDRKGFGVTPPMKKIGLLGGMAWPSTIEYYRAICAGANARFRAAGHGLPLPQPWITIESVNMAETRALRGSHGDEASWKAYDDVLRGVMHRLEAAGCDVLAMASNTPHARLHPFRDDLSAPVISILDETAEAASRAGMKRALVLGTSVTMQGEHYPEVLSAHGIDALPRRTETEIEAMQTLIDSDFHEGATAQGKQVLLEFCRKSVEAPAETAVLLACTELPLAWPEHADDPVFEADGFTFVNTGAAHVTAILDAALE